MPVPSSGPLRLRADINLEVNGNDTDNNVSLGSLSDASGFTEPDTMSEFYSYTSCTAPTQIGSQSGSFNNSGQANFQAIMRGNGGCDITDCGLYVGTSSSIGSATKYSLHSSWNMHTWRYFSVSGFSNNTSYYVWIYATNSAGEFTQSMGQYTVPPPYVPVSYGQHLVNSGDWSNNMYCPVGNFIGGFYFHYNCGVTCELYVYGGQSFTGNSGSLGGVCQNRAGWFGANQWRYNLVNFSSPCGISGSTGTNYTGWGIVAAPNYANSARSTTKTCQ